MVGTEPNSTEQQKVSHFAPLGFANQASVCETCVHEAVSILYDHDVDWDRASDGGLHPPGRHWNGARVSVVETAAV